MKVVETVLRRVLKDQREPRLVDLINEYRLRGIITSEWAETLHRWRELRNACAHNVFSLSVMQRAMAEEVVLQAPELFVIIEEYHVPSQASLHEHDQRVAKLRELVDLIKTGQPHPKTGRPVRALRFREREDASDMLLFQLLMLLSDVRYYMPREYRWTTAPVFARLSNALLGYCHQAIRGTSNHRFNHMSQAESDRVLGQMRLIVLDVLGHEATDRLLIDAFNEAQRTGNGDYPSGLKLNPKNA